MRRGHLALVLTGGGARAAYQVGFLKALAEDFPDLELDVLTGVSAGAINAAFLANHTGRFSDTASALTQLWLDLSPDKVFEVDPGSLLGNVFGWMLRLGAGGSKLAPRVRGLMNTRPLDQVLERALSPDADGRLSGIEQNLEAGRLAALALSAVDYSTGETVTWVEGRNVTMWERPHRHSEAALIGVDHVMASAALPMLFPAVKVGESWYGDGGIRLAAPLSPAIHLGANRIIALSTRFQRGPHARAQPATDGYPPPAQVAGVLLNAIFLDMLDQDALRLERINQLIAAGPAVHLPDVGRLELIDLEVLRPSRDLGRLASDYESRLPKVFRYLTRGLGTRETKSPDVLSMLMFQSDYLSALIEIGYEDARGHSDRLAELVAENARRDQRHRLA